MLRCSYTMLSCHDLKGNSTTLCSSFYRISSLQTDIQSSLTAVGFQGTISVGTPAIAAQVKWILSLICVYRTVKDIEM